MSLINAFLTEPYSGFDVYIALRTDGALGSGRADDPYSGGNLDNPRLSILTLTRIGTTATVKTTGPHGYFTNQRVQIGAVRGIEAAADTDLDRSSYYNGIFVITVTASDTFTYVMAGDPGGSGCGACWCKLDSGVQITSLTYSAGTGLATAVTATPHGFKANDCVRIAGVTGISGAGTNLFQFYNGSLLVTPDPVDNTKFTYAPGGDPGGSAVSTPGLITCRLDPYVFDRVMRMLPSVIPANSYARVFVGPGVYDTTGYTSVRAASSWQLQQNMKLIGAGMSQTTLRLVDANLDDQGHYCIYGGGGSFLNTAEVADMTCDVNLAGQSGFNIMAGALVIQGRFTRVKRVRVINYGTQTLKQECFPLGICYAFGTTPNVTNCLVENCVIEQPSLNNSRETTCIQIFKGEVPLGPQGFFSASAIRGCAIDCAYQDRPQRVSGVTVTGSEAVVDTPLPHLLTTGQWVRLSGARVASATNQFDNDFNGSFKVAVLTSTQFKYSLPSSGLLSPSGDIWSGRWPSQRIPLNPGATVGVSGLSQISVSPNVWKMQVKTSTPHYAVPGGTIVLNSVIPSSGTLPDVPLNGVWRVTRVLSNKDFVCQAEFAASQVPMSPTNLSAAFIVPNFHGMSIGGGTVGIAEGNFVANCAVGGPYQDTYSTKDMIVRRNHYKGVRVALFHNLGGYSGGPDLPTPPRPINVTNVGSVGIVTMANAHGYTTGQPVQITGVTVGGSDINPFNNATGSGVKYVVKDIPQTPADPANGLPTSFTYEMTAAPGSGPIVWTTAEVRVLWQIRECIVEDNTIELIPTANDGSQSVGISLYGTPLPPFDFPSTYFFRHLLLRNNRVRYVESTPAAEDANSADVGVQVLYCENALIDGNVVDLRRRDGTSIANPLRHRSCGVVSYALNRNSQGELIQGASWPSEFVTNPQDELATRIEDALLW